MNDSFSSKNKYKGREIKTSDFYKVLKHFLYDGERLLVSHIPSIIQKLHNLAEIMLDLDGFRFYGCSLLLIYDGDKEAQDHYERQHIRASTGAATNATGTAPHTILERVDEDEWVDIRHRPSRTPGTAQDEEELEQTRSSSARRSKSVEYDPISHRSRHRRHSHNRGESQDHRDQGVDTSDQPHNTSSSSSNTKRLRGEVNIRVVDFAHTTTGLDFIPFPADHVDPPELKLGKGYDTRQDPLTGLNLARFPPKHTNQPDMGFVFGLKNVCVTLEGLWRDEIGDEEVDSWLKGMDNRDVFLKAFGSGVGEEGGLDLEGELST